MRERRLLRARHRLADHDVCHGDARARGPTRGSGRARRRPIARRRPRTRRRRGPSRDRATRAARARSAAITGTDGAARASVTPRDRHAATGTRPSTCSYTPARRTADPVPGVALLGQPARRKRRAWHARLLVGKQPRSCASARAAGSPGGTLRPVFARHDVAVSLDVGGDDRRRARECARSAPSRSSRRRATARPSPSRRAALPSAAPGGRKPRISIPSDGVRSFAIRSLTASGSAPITRRRRAGPAVDLRPGAEQDRQALAGLLAPDEEDAVLAAGRVGLGRDQHAVRDHLVVARASTAFAEVARLLRHRDTVHRSGRAGSPRPASTTSPRRARPRRGTSRRRGTAPARARRCTRVGVIGSWRCSTSNRSRSSAA